MTTMNNTITNAPRWVTTEAGQRAWQVDEEWRSTANRALSVQDRHRLLIDAEQKQQLQEQVV